MGSGTVSLVTDHRSMPLSSITHTGPLPTLPVALIGPVPTVWMVCALLLRSHWWKVMGAQGAYTRHPRVHMRASIHTSSPKNKCGSTEAGG